MEVKAILKMVNFSNYKECVSKISEDCLDIDDKKIFHSDKCKNCYSLERNKCYHQKIIIILTSIYYKFIIYLT